MMIFKISSVRFIHTLFIFLGAYFLLALPSVVQAAPIIFDSSSHVRAPNVTAVNLPVTITEKNEILLCFTADDVITNTDAVDFNGVPMINFTAVEDVEGYFKLWGFYLINPAIGTHQAVFTRNVAEVGNEWWVNCSAYKNAAQTAPEAYNVLANISGTSHSATVTTETSGAWTVMYGLANLGEMSAGTNSTLRGSILNTASGLFDSNGAITPVQEYSMAFNSIDGGGTAIIVSLAPESSKVLDCKHYNKKNCHKNKHYAKAFSL